jgi:hypothetical protein
VSAAIRISRPEFAQLGEVIDAITKYFCCGKDRYRYQHGERPGGVVAFKMTVGKGVKDLNDELSDSAVSQDAFP